MSISEKTEYGKTSEIIELLFGFNKLRVSGFKAIFKKSHKPVYNNGLIKRLKYHRKGLAAR